MNVNEVLANRALQLLGGRPATTPASRPWTTSTCTSPPTTPIPPPCAWRRSACCATLEEQVVALQEAFQEKEQQFAHVVKVGRTEMQDAVLTTLGREMGAYAEAFARDRWRIYKCEERLRVVNLGGTAIGTGLAAPRQYIFRVVDTCASSPASGFARAENLVEATQNADVFVEVSRHPQGAAPPPCSRSATTCASCRPAPTPASARSGCPQRQAGLAASCPARSTR